MTRASAVALYQTGSQNVISSPRHLQGETLSRFGWVARSRELRSRFGPAVSRWALIAIALTTSSQGGEGWKVTDSHKRRHSHCTPRSSRQECKTSQANHSYTIRCMQSIKPLIDVVKLYRRTEPDPACSPIEQYQVMTIMWRQLVEDVAQRTVSKYQPATRPS